MCLILCELQNLLNLSDLKQGPLSVITDSARPEVATEGCHNRFSILYDEHAEVWNLVLDAHHVDRAMFQLLVLTGPPLYCLS